MPRSYVQLFLTKEEAEITSDKVVPLGLRKGKISHMNLKFKVASLNLISQRMTQSSQEDVYLLFLTAKMANNWLLLLKQRTNTSQEKLVYTTLL